MPKKVHYERLSVFERNIFYTNDLKALEKEVYKYYRKEDIDLEEMISGNHSGVQGFAASISKRDDPERVLFYVMFVKDDTSIGTVSHEATHICNQIFLYIGQLADEVNDEVQAYFVGHLTNVFCENIRGYKKTSNVLTKGKYKSNIG